jgi:hypothetical protein
MWPGVRRAGRPTAEPGADAGPAAPQAPLLIAWLVRLIVRVLRLVFRHPVPALIVAMLAFLWVSIGWIGVTVLAGRSALVLVIWWHYWPVTFGRGVATPARSKWRAWGTAASGPR